MIRKVKVLIADDHPIISEGVKKIVEELPDMDVIGVLHNGRELIGRAKEDHPDLIILDITMDELNGIDAAKQLCSEIPDLKVIALSSHTEGEIVESMFKAGAKGYVLKNSAVEEIPIAIKAVMEGKPYFSQEIAPFIMDRLMGSSGGKTGKSELSPREREVLQLIAEGNSTKDVAHKLNLSVKTIETHRQKIMNKLDINNVAELTKYAIKIGLTNL